MAGLRLGGLASGMDTEAVIAQLMALEAQPKNRLVLQQKRAEAFKTVLDEVAKRLRTLQTAIRDLSSASTWVDVQKVTSSDDTRVSARQIGTAPAGVHTVEVLKLARVEQRAYTYSNPNSITIDGIAVDTSKATTVEAAATAINGTANMTVIASVVNGQLVLTGKTLGKSITVTANPTAKLTEDTTKQVLAQKTSYKINGVLQEETTASVVQPGGLPGVELTIKALTSAPVSITVGAPGPDTDKVKAQVKAFVEAYNGAIDHIRGQLAERKVASPSLPSEYGKGALRGDVALSGLLGRLRQTVSDVVAGNPTTSDELADIGISVAKSTGGKPSADALAGKLVLDEVKLAEALAANPDAVQQLIGGVSGVEGVAQRLQAALDPILASRTGYIDGRSAAADSQIDRLKDRQLDFDRRLALKEQRLRAQFTAMEAALNASYTQTAWIQGQIAGLPTWNTSSS